MFTQEQRTFLDKPFIARLATNGKDGYPHAVPLWYGIDGDDVIIISDRAAVKVTNALNNPKAAITMGGEPGDGGAYMIRGDLLVEEDPNQHWTRIITLRYETPEEAERVLESWKNDDIIVLRMKVRKVSKVF